MSHRTQSTWLAWWCVGLAILMVGLLREYLFAIGFGLAGLAWLGWLAWQDERERRERRRRRDERLRTRAEAARDEREAA